MSQGERNAIVILAFILMAVGLYIGYAMPYRVSETITMHDHPFGFLLGGIGFVMLLYAMFTKPVETAHPISFQERARTRRQVCGTCFWMGKPECKRNERLFHAKPCEDYTQA